MPRFLIILFFLSQSWSSFGEVDFPKLISKEKPLSISIQNEYFNTQANYQFLGEYSYLTKNNFLTSVANNLEINYYLFNWLNVGFFFNTRFVATQTDRTLRNRFGMTQTGFSLDFLKGTKYFQMILELKGGIPLHKIQQDQQIILGDGSVFANPHLWLIYQHPTRLFHVFYNINFLYRMSELSSLLYNKAGFAFQTHLANFGLAANFFMPVVKDVYSLSPQKRWSLTDQVNGGSYKFYSVNPIALSFTGWIKWKFNFLSVNTYFDLDTYGQNYAKGITVGVMTNFKWDTKTKKISDVEDFKKNYTRKPKYFKEIKDTESNQELMEELGHLR